MQRSLLPRLARAPDKFAPMSTGILAALGPIGALYISDDLVRFPLFAGFATPLLNRCRHEIGFREACVSGGPFMSEPIEDQWSTPTGGSRGRVD